MLRIGLKRLRDLDAARNVVERKVAEGNRREKRCAAHIRQDRILHLADRTIQNIGVNLTPDVGLRATAN